MDEFGELSLPEEFHRRYGEAMRANSSSEIPSRSSFSGRTGRSATVPTLHGESPIPEGDSRRLRAWRRLTRLADRWRKGWWALEAFLIDYYRACGITAAPTDSAGTCRVHLRAGELLTLVKPQRSTRLEIIRGEIWLTQTPASNDLLLGPGARFDLGDAFPVVVEALEATEIVLRA